MIGLCISPRFIEHETGPQHPEQPDRLCAIYAALSQAGLLSSPNPFPDFKVDFGQLPVFTEKLFEVTSLRSASEEWLGTVHTIRHIKKVQRICELGGGLLDQGDTPVGPNGYEIAILAAGGVLCACDAVMEGQVPRCFAAIRPPGHHAEPDRAMGFCLFNNVAIAARYLQKMYEVQRVAIVDFDVHHGNGTQGAFDCDPSVLFVSLHQNPRNCYPGSGYAWERGSGPGEGFTLNIPLEPGTGDAEYYKAIDTQVLPELDKFRPQVLLISAGFDAHVDDPLASLELTDDAFERITRSLVTVAEQHCGGRVISVLEGGYNFRALGRSVLRHLIGLGAK